MNIPVILYIYIYVCVCVCVCARARECVYDGLSDDADLFYRGASLNRFIIAK